MSTQPAQMPSIQDLFAKVGIYERMSVPQTREDDLHSIIFGRFRFDAYCVACKQGSTFHGIQEIDAFRLVMMKRDSPGVDDTILARAKCQRCDMRYTFLFLYEDSILTKVGQSPSYASLAQGELTNFRGVIEQVDRDELSRAYGLFAHGVGVGSFVYLRRIFERMIQRHRKQYEAEHGPVIGFDAMRMNERIQAIASYLPDTLVENRAAYGILSSGIHEMSEQNCLAQFPIVRDAIELILEEEMHEKQKQARAEKLRRSIAQLASQNGHSSSSEQLDEGD